MTKTQRTQPNNLLSLDDAAQTLGVDRPTLTTYIKTLGVSKQRGSDRRSYLATQDVERIQAWQESKVNPAYSGLTLMSDVPMPRQMSRNVKAFVEEGFAMDNTFYKAVTYITQNAAAIPPKLYTDATRQDEIKSHPLLDKLAKPNNEHDGVFYRESVLGWYLITGNSFQYAIRRGKSGPPDELWALEVTKVHPLPSKIRGIVGYNFDDFPDSQNPILPENIGHMRTWNPKDPIFGMAAVEPGAILLDEQLAARKWQLALLQNYAKPPGAWVFDGILDVNTRKKVKEALNLEMAGYRNAGKTPVLDGGFKWVSSMTPPSELDWLNSIKYNASQIADLFNIAPELIGDTSASTYNNMREAKAASYTEAIFPALDKLYSLWNTWLVPMYPDLKNAYLYYDKTTVEVVQDAIQTRLSEAVDRANKAWMQGTCTLNEAREQQDLPPLPGGDIFRFGNVLVRASELDKYAEQSLQTPAAPPIPVPEPLNGPQSEPQQQPQEDEQSSKPNDEQDQTESKAKKPTDGQLPSASVEKQLDEYEARGVTHLTWHLGARLHHCDNCKKNDGTTVALRSPFPSGVFLPPQHPDCDCDVEFITKSKQLVQVTRKAARTVVPSVEERIAEMQARGVTHVSWVLGVNCCVDCKANDGIQVKLSEPFPSGILLPPQCTACQCTVVEHIESEQKSIDISERQKKQQARNAYRDFMEALV